MESTTTTNNGDKQTIINGDKQNTINGEKQTIINGEKRYESEKVEDINHRFITKMIKLDTLEFLANVKNREDIFKWCLENPTEDYVYCIKGEGIFCKMNKYEGRPKGPKANRVLEIKNMDINVDYYTAGSSAAQYFVDKYNEFSNKHFEKMINDLISYTDTPEDIKKVNKNLIKLSFTPEDTDIFHLKNNFIGRKKVGNVDHVYVEDQSPSELIYKFDIPCCRVAYDINGNIWITAQCINSIFNGVYYMPNYTKDITKFKDIITANFKVYKHFSRYLPTKDVHKINDAISANFRKLNERIEKYRLRGYNAVYIETQKPILWFFARLDYVLIDNEDF
jgi:hypothetical protein